MFIEFIELGSLYFTTVTSPYYLATFLLTVLTYLLSVLTAVATAVPNYYSFDTRGININSYFGILHKNYLLWIISVKYKLFCYKYMRILPCTSVTIFYFSWYYLRIFGLISLIAVK